MRPIRMIDGRRAQALTTEENTRHSGAVAQVVGLLAVVTLSCGLGIVLPSQSTFPTAAPGEVDTVVAGTAAAAQSETAEWLPASPTPSPTPTATRTPTVTPSVTPTFVFYLNSPVPPKTATPVGGASTSTSSGSGGYGCVLVSQKPADGTVFKSNAKFDMVWTVQNSGGKTWQADSVDYAYVSGKKMQAQDIYDLPKNVAPGETVGLTVKMNAPKNAGEWKTVWTLQTNGNDFCHVDVTIVVN